jgi:hypothetical protein
LFKILKGRDYSEDPQSVVSIILNWILSKQGARIWIAFIWIKIGTERVFLYNDTSGSIKGGEFLSTSQGEQSSTELMP